MVDEKAARDAAVTAALRDSALMMLLEQAGGSIEFTREDFEALLERHGGRSRLSVHVEVVREAGKPDRVRASLRSTQPGQGSLPV